MKIKTQEAIKSNRLNQTASLIYISNNFMSDTIRHKVLFYYLYIHHHREIFSLSTLNFLTFQRIYFLRWSSRSPLMAAATLGGGQIDSMKGCELSFLSSAEDEFLQSLLKDSTLTWQGEFSLNYEAPTAGLQCPQFDSPFL